MSGCKVRMDLKTKVGIGARGRRYGGFHIRFLVGGSTNRHRDQNEMSFSGLLGFSVEKFFAEGNRQEVMVFDDGSAIYAVSATLVITVPFSPFAVSPNECTPGGMKLSSNESVCIRKTPRLPIMPISNVSHQRTCTLRMIDQTTYRHPDTPPDATSSRKSETP